ncbi:MAG TPA: hypothetical protein VHQ86_02885, partial [Candidatus Saccharimonadia bacterium]|nr:hypothetical protein [Candidatus Saccharimonadia bacterium]
NLNSSDINTSNTTVYGQLLGLDANGNVGISNAAVSLTSPALAYWDGVNDPTVGSNAYPTPTVSGDASFVSSALGERLTRNVNTLSGSINWSFAQVPFEEVQFQFQAGGGTGADSTWFYSYADGVPTTEYGSSFTNGYLIYFSEYWDCIGIAYGPFTDGNQCKSGGGANPLTSYAFSNGNGGTTHNTTSPISDGNFHDVDIQFFYNQIIVRWDGQILIQYTDVYGRNATFQDFGFGSRTGGSNNNHYIKGLLVTKLGTNTSQYGVNDKNAPLASNMYWSNSFNSGLSVMNQGALGVGTAAPTATLEVDGTSQFDTIVTSAGKVCQSNAANCTSTTAGTTVFGTGTSFVTAGVAVGDKITFADGYSTTVASVVSNTQLTVALSALEWSNNTTPGVDYTIYRPISSTSGTILQVGSNSTTSGANTLLGLGSFNTYTESATCTTSSNQGALYYNTNTAAMRGCVNGAWEDVITTSGLGIIAFGIIPDSGPTAGDTAGITGVDTTSGPCRVYMGSVANSVRWTGCTMYTGGRKQIIAAQTTNFTTGITTTGSAFQNLCVFTNGSAPSFGTANTTETSATVPTWNAGAPAVCLATIKEIAGGSGIGAIYDTRFFTTSTKHFGTLSTASSPGFAVKLNGTAGQSVPVAATTDPFFGVVAAWSGTTQTTAINSVIVTGGPVYVKATAATVGAYVRPTATSGHVNTSALVTTAQTDVPYNYLGLAQTTFNAPGTQCSTTANANTCLGSILTTVDIR